MVFALIVSKECAMRKSTGSSFEKGMILVSVARQVLNARNFGKCSELMILTYEELLFPNYLKYTFKIIELALSQNLTCISQG